MADSTLQIVYKPGYLEYDFGPGHPFTPVRWDRLQALLHELAIRADWIEPGDASDDDILSVHTLAFVEAVKAASAGHGTPQSHYVGLGTSDVPIFFGMHEATQAICGGSLDAARLVLEGDARRVMQLGGGLHHAMPGRAAGFCIYNDVAMAIRRLVDGGMRVAFLDIDVHHSDGVQEIFYNEPAALTISLHESGHYLFPGTGFEDERGGSEAPGSAINIPLHPGTRDVSYLECFDAVVPQALRAFSADVLVVEVGADAYFGDPLASISLTTAAYASLFDRIAALADECAGGRLITTLGGGYNVEATVRIWAMLAHRMSDTPLPDEPVLLDRDPHLGSDRAAEVAGVENRKTIQRLRENY